MAVRIPGWASQVGTAHGVRLGTVRHENVFSWRAVRADRVVLGQAAHLCLLQGDSPVRVFLASCFDDGRESLSGLHLLSFSASPPWRVPYVFRDVVIGQLLDMKENTSLSWLLPYMLERAVKDGC